MTVRKTTKTTVSVLILITGFVFFRLYYIKLLSRFLYFISSNDEYFSVISGRLFPKEYIGTYYPGFFYFCVMLIIAVRLIDAILDYKVAFKALAPFGLPLIFTVIVTIALCIVKINILQLWAIFYLCLIICLHSTLKRILTHSETVGSNADLKLVKVFFLTIKDTILKIVSKNKRKFNNPVDEATILSASFLILLLEAGVIISFIIYLAVHWRLIFLSHLIDSF